VLHYISELELSIYQIILNNYQASNKDIKRHCFQHWW